MISALVARHSTLDPASITDVILGCANQAGEDNRNVARMAVLLAGLPQSVPGVTVNRLCASGLSAIVEACALANGAVSKTNSDATAALSAGVDAVNAGSRPLFRIAPTAAGANI